MPDKPHLLPPPQEEPQQPTFPLTQVTVNPDHVLIQTYYTATKIDTTILPEATVNQIMSEWVKSRKALQSQISTIAAGRRSRND